MARKKPLVNDIDTAHPDERRAARAVLTSDTEKALNSLTQLLLSQRQYVRESSPIITKREADRKFHEWLATSAPVEIRAKAARLAMETNREKAYEFLKSEFFTACPEYIPNTKQGRPGWYIARGTQQRIAQGEIISMLLNLAGEKLKGQLLAPSENERAA